MYHLVGCEGLVVFGPLPAGDGWSDVILPLVERGCRRRHDVTLGGFENQEEFYVAVQL